MQFLSVLVSESSVEPVSITEQRTFMKIDSTDSTAEDSLIGSFITAARKEAENLTRRALVSQTRQLILDDFPTSTDAIELPFAPLNTASSSVAITYVEDTTAGNTTTIASTVYTIDANSEPGRVYPSFNNEWPSGVRDQRNAVTIQYVTGYSTSTIPAGVVAWIRMRVLDLYENRETISSLQRFPLPTPFMKALLDPYTIRTAI